MTLYEHLEEATRRLGHRPAITFRDAASGERTELSFVTTHNWVSKTANLLLDRFDAGLGAEVHLDSPLHWLVPVVAMGTWATGASLRIGPSKGADLGSRGNVDVTVRHELDAPSEADLLLGAGMAGRPLDPDAVPSDALLVTDILAEPDDFVDDPGDDGAWAVDARTQATLWAERMDGGPVLLAGDRVDEETVLMIARTLAAGVAVVMARGYDVEGLRQLSQEEGLD